MTYLHVRNWNTYQHYTDRNPPWIKLHVKLLDDLQMREKLTPQARLLWPHLLLVASRYNNHFKDDEIWLGSVLDLDPIMIRSAIDELRKGRWLTRKRASAAIAPRKPSRAGKSREEKPSTGPSSSTPREGPSHKPATFTTDIQAGLGSESMAHALRLLANLTTKDDGTKARVMGYASKLPPAAFTNIIEKLAERNGQIKNDAAYACSELERMVKEGQYA